jgi:WD40 repeat protein
MVEVRTNGTLLQRALDFVFGYDFFISYSHSDGSNYPVRLKEHLQQAGFKIFLDVSEYAAGTDLRRETIRQVSKSRKLLVVARRAALASEWVRREVDVGLSQGKIPIIVNINSAVEKTATTSPISKLAIERQWLVLNESIDEPDGNPSNYAIAELVRGFNNTRQETKRLRLMAAASVVLAAATAIAIWQGIVAKSNEQTALKERDAATANESRALSALSQAASLKLHYADAVMLAVAAWPRAGDRGRPFLQQTIDALSVALPNLRERARWFGNKPFQAAKFVPGTNLFVSMASRGPLELWNAETWKRLKEFGTEDDAFSSLSISTDGELLGAGMLDGSARIYDLRNRTLLASTKAHSAGIKNAIFSLDGIRIATVSDDKSVKVWNARTLEPISRLPESKDDVNGIDFSHDGNQILTQTINGINIYDVKAGKVITNIPGANSSSLAGSAAFVGAGDRIATAWLDGISMVSEASSGRPLKTLNDCVHSIGAIVRSQDRSRFLLSCNQKGVIYDSDSLNTIATIAGPSASGQATFSADDKFVASVVLNGYGELWDGTTGQKIGDLTGHTDGIHSVDFSSRNDIVTASSDRTVRLWNLAFGRSRLLGRFGDSKGVGPKLSTASLSSDGEEVLLLGAGDAIQVLTVGSLVEHDLVAQGTFKFARFCESRKSVFAIEYLGDMLVISNPDSKTLLRLKGNATAGSCSPKGDTFAAGDKQGVVRLYDLKTGELKTVLGEVTKNMQVSDIIYSPDGNFLAASGGSKVKVWSLNRVPSATVLIENESIIQRLQYSADGAEIAVASGISIPTRVFDAITGRLRVSLQDSNVIHRAVFFGPGGQRLITPRGKTAIVWDRATGAAIAAFGPHQADVIWASFTLDGKSVLAVSIDGEARIWDSNQLEMGDAFSVACQRFLDTASLDQIAGSAGLIDLNPICSAGHEPIAPQGK